MIHTDKLITTARTRLADTGQVTFSATDMQVFVEDAVSVYNRLSPLSLRSTVSLVADRDTYPAPDGIIAIDDLLSWPRTDWWDAVRRYSYHAPEFPEHW